MRHRRRSREDRGLCAVEHARRHRGRDEFSTLTVGDPTDSNGLELDVIAAVVIGGAPLAGGEGSILGSVFGALLMTVIRTGAVHMGMPSWVQYIVTGVIIFVAVAVDSVRRRRISR